MNHAYRLVRNTEGRTVPAAELTRARGKPGGPALRLAGAAVLATLAVSSHALPTGNQTVAGQGNVASSGGAMTVTQVSPNLSINWQGFSIGAGESVRFVQPSASSVALNRVVGGDPSAIYGNLSANGQVFLINPNGVLFGPGARVDVGGLVASTLDISDADFAARRLKFSSNNNARPAAVLNQGTLTAATGGYIALLGGQASNQGTISARLGTAALAAGNAITLDFSGDKLLGVKVDAGAYNALADNGQLINADGGTVIMTAGARDALLSTVVNNSGVIEARTVENRGGVITLLGTDANGHLAGTVKVAGTLDVSAPAALNPGGGDAGFVETSGANVEIVAGAQVRAGAAQGRAGTWLIDPTDILINAAAAGTIAGTLNGGGNVTQNTSSGGTDAGNITVAAPITWSGTGTLSLTADHDIAINAAISGVNGGLTLSAANNISAPAAVNVGTFTLASGNWSQLNSTLPAFSATNFRLQGGAFLRALGGDGSTANPRQLTDVYGLQGIGSSPAMLSQNYALAGDINAAGTATWNSNAGFKPIGDSTTTFTGSLDGQGHAINNLAISRTGSNYIGLFGYLGTGSKVLNLGLVGGSVKGTNQVGALAGYNNGTVDNTYATGTVTGNEDVGGLVGVNNSTLSRSHATGAVSSSNYGGGLVGENHGTLSTVYATGAVRAFFSGGLAGYNDGTINVAYATGSVRGFAGVGGLVGINSLGTISNAYATGAVSASNMYGGGLIGYNQSGTISNTYASGLVTGGSSKAGLIGNNFGTSVVSNSYWDTQSTGQSVGMTGAAATGGPTAMTTATATSQATYGGFDFSSTWTIYEGHTYGLLRAFMTPLTVTAANASKTYDGLAYSGGNGLSLPPGTDASKVLGTAVYGGTSQGARNAGAYGITLSGLYSTQQGYLISYAPGTLTINPKSIGVSASASDKVYDGNTGASVTLSSTGLIAGDVVSFSSTSANFDNKNAGTGKTVTVSGISAGGAASGNYVLSGTTTTTTASITPKTVTVNANASDKVYDGNTTASVTLSATGLISGDTVSFNNTSANFDNKNAGSGKTVTVSGITAGGADAGNYSYANGATTTASITPKALTINASASDKVYDGGTGATVSLGAVGVISGDTVSLTGGAANFADRNVGNGKAVNISGITAGGGDAGNYSVATSAATTASITPATLTYVADAASRTVGTAPTGLTGSLTGLAGGDTLASATTGSTAWTTPASAASAAGTYAILGGGLTANHGNYVFQQAAGNNTALTLTLAPPAPSGGSGSGSGTGSSAGNGSGSTPTSGQVLADLNATQSATLSGGEAGAQISANNTFSAPPPPCMTGESASGREDGGARQRGGASNSAGCEQTRPAPGTSLRVLNLGIRLPAGLSAED